MKPEEACKMLGEFEKTLFSQENLAAQMYINQTGFYKAIFNARAKCTFDNPEILLDPTGVVTELRGIVQNHSPASVLKQCDDLYGSDSMMVKTDEMRVPVTNLVNSLKAALGV